MTHVNAAEAVLRRGMINRDSWHYPLIDKLIEFNYIENKSLNTRFQVRGRDEEITTVLEGINPKLCVLTFACELVSSGGG
jgi:hypothetical protein